MKHCRPLRHSVAWGALTALGCLLASSPAAAATLSTEAAADLELEPYIEGLAGPTDVAVLPDGRVVAIEQAGGVFTKPVGDGEPLEARVELTSSSGEQGLLGVVADPDFATNQYIYFYASAGANNNNRHQVQRYKLGADGQLTDKKIVVDMGLRGPANHNGGGIDIYQGNLYIGVGDTGFNSTNGTPQNRFSSCLNIANGKVLRVSLAEATLGQPPADNPLMNEAMVTGCDSVDGDFGMRAPEKRIFAWGFRNPFRLWVDRSNGKVWVGDVGEISQEEVSIVEKGKHYGYPFVEGTKTYQQAFQPQGACMGMVPASACTPPVTTFETQGDGAVIGGRILDGCDWPAVWKSRYVFGDHEQNRVWFVDVNPTRDGVMAAEKKDFATTNQIRAIKMGTDNALYLVEGVGTVSRVTAKDAMSTPGSCPTVDGSGQPNGGSGGAGGGGGGAAGGSSNTGGSGNSAAGSSAGGAPGGGGPSNTAGSPSAAGSQATAGSGTGGSGGGGSSDDGCGCQVVGGPTSSLLGLGALATLMGLAFRRRRRG